MLQKIAKMRSWMKYSMLNENNKLNKLMHINKKIHLWYKHSVKCKITSGTYISPITTHKMNTVKCNDTLDNSVLLAIEWGKSGHTMKLLLLFSIRFYNLLRCEIEGSICDTQCESENYFVCANNFMWKKALS